MTSSPSDAAVSTKKCSMCLQVLPLTEFYTRGKSHDNYCKECRKAYMRLYKKSYFEINPQKHQEQNTRARNWYRENKMKQGGQSNERD